ncbi:esterase B1-like [Anopheles ziemanni]|uniref:esterase B1-like n=1 Tax=Anopheles coustani TaxID=139045 RepID=UPI00265A4F11|nr:esterase B1-like [Anopheles coustani]XP_058178547.1 esterase B1-like [Anopheles ziemanni]
MCESLRTFLLISSPASSLFYSRREPNMVMRSAPLMGWKNVSTGSDAEKHMPIARICVQVQQGSIYGVRDRLPNGQNYYYFKGVPYARPPVGLLRFKSPVPLEKYAVSYLDCTKERSNCMGLDVLSKEISGSEDGLFLNIYTPKLGKKDDPEPLPVMVFIHGGGLIGGHGDSSLYLPNYLVQQGVLVVTVNYRLGVLGFLCLPDAGVEGNAGLKDQRMALRWVIENIAQFGGDPGNVTLFGASSGAIAVNFHCLSRESKRYFHKAILQSGSIYTEFSFQDQPEEKARKLAKLLGHSPQTDVEVYEVLRNAPAKKVFELQPLVLTEREKAVEKLFQIPFLPVIERVDSGDAIITQHPSEILSEPDGIGIPIILGYNERDGMMVLIDAIKTLATYNAEPERFIPRTVAIDYFSPEARTLGEEIREFYFGSKSVNRDTLNQLTDVFTDKYLLAYRMTVELWARYQRKTKFFGYRFAFDGLLNKGKAIMSLKTMKGAAHIDEVYYLFSSPLLRTEVPETDRSYELRNTMVQLWTNFAKYSDPTPEDVATGDKLPFRWEPQQNVPETAEQVPLMCLDISNSGIRMCEMPEKRRMDFWTQIYQRYNGRLSEIKVPVVSSSLADENNNI